MLTLILASVCLAAALTMSACSVPDDFEIEEQPVTASQYMVNLNDKTVVLDDKLQEFVDAVNEGRISAMQTKAQEAFVILDEMANLEAPDDIADLKSQYNDASNQLKTALNDYM